MFHTPLRLPLPALLLPLLLIHPLGCSAGPDSAALYSTDTDTGDALLPLEECGYTPATDLDPAAGIVEVNLAAAAFEWDPGTGVALTEGVAYDDSVPGPLIEANAGDTVVVHFTNNLNEPTTVHWHGIRLESAMDGGMQMMDPILPGETFDYTFTVPDAGFYWYHPHLEGAKLIERGLYGRMIVHAPDEIAADCDLPIALDDILLDEGSWQVAPVDTDMMKLMGRLGNMLLANGKAGRRVALTAGETVLLRLVNPSNARYWDVYVEGQQLQVVATDGGWLPEPYATDSLVIAPGERYTVAFTATGDPESEVRLMNKRFQLHEQDGDMIEVDPLGDGDNPVLTFVLGEGTVVGTPWTQPAVDPMPYTGPTETFGHHWILAEDMMGGTVTIDGAAWPDVPLVTVEANLETTFDVENTSEMHHPFHIHGNNFQIVQINGVAPTTPQGWKDTWDVPPRSTVTVVSDLWNAGDWMYHCHILEHAEGGMMGELVVGASTHSM
ncbi:MAG: multicopper oxidase family protein [Myxococcales bacterium]|nr:multicopper oxidase family protein [Myxococcales bacterium]